VSDNQLQKKRPNSIKEKGQYFLAFGVVASMLLVAGFPVFVIFFFGIFAYFLLKMFVSGSRNETREIFEFYLSANEMLRDDERKWFGFEIKDCISRGEALLHRMSGAPPLVYFTLGALYNKAGDHQAAVNYLSRSVENESADEATYVYPSPELRNYVKVLRKIERDPADAPLTSASVRALERARKMRGRILLEDSRTKFAQSAAAEAKSQEVIGNGASPPEENNFHKSNRRSVTDDTFAGIEKPVVPFPGLLRADRERQNDSRKKSRKDPFVDRKPITEVLHDIYDKNIQ
jgi:hypothetical protein